jgi:hypothetical protein
VGDGITSTGVGDDAGAVAEGLGSTDGVGLAAEAGAPATVAAGWATADGGVQPLDKAKIATAKARMARLHISVHQGNVQ